MFRKYSLFVLRQTNYKKRVKSETAINDRLDQSWWSYKMKLLKVSLYVFCIYELTYVPLQLKIHFTLPHNLQVDGTFTGALYTSTYSVL